MKKKLLIIGGGFSGSIIAKKLENLFDITLVDTKDYFEFTPGILKNIINGFDKSEIRVLHSSYLKKSKIIVGRVKKVFKNYVLINDKKINYDYLIISSGSGYNSPIKEENVILSSRTRSIIRSRNKLKKSKNIVIIGGGIVGVELAAELIYEYPNKNIQIIDSNSRLISRNTVKSSLYVQNYLSKKNVKIILNERVIKYKDNKILTDKGNKYSADLIYVCNGIKPNTNFLDKKFLNKKYFLNVNDYLQVDGFFNIFGAGDVTSVFEEKTAQNATKHSKIVIENLKRIESNKELIKYKSDARPIVISLGKNNGIFLYKNMMFTGVFVSILKNIIQKKHMLNYKLNSFFI